MIHYSVIIPHYNDVDRLDRLLKSIPINRKDLEVIVVDDCSSEQLSFENVRDNWSQVHWLKTPQNSGAGVARNLGLGAATGRWLVFADSDDEFIKDAFETFDDNLYQNDELVYFLAEGKQEVDESPSLSVRNINDLVVAYSNSQSSENRDALQFQHVVPWAKIYSHHFIKSIEVQFDPVLLSNDIAFNVLAAVQAKHIRVVPLQVYRYYKRHGSLMTNVNSEAFLLRFEQSRNLAERLAKLGLENVRPATGYMLRSIKYGPRVVFYVWVQALRSPMKIEWLRLLQPSRWGRFWCSQRSATKEHSRLGKDSKCCHSTKDRST